MFDRLAPNWLKCEIKIFALVYNNQKYLNVKICSINQTLIKSLLQLRLKALNSVQKNIEGEQL